MNKKMIIFISIIGSIIILIVAFLFAYFIYNFSTLEVYEADYDISDYVLNPPDVSSLLSTQINVEDYPSPAPEIKIFVSHQFGKDSCQEWDATYFIDDQSNIEDYGYKARNEYYDIKDIPCSDVDYSTLTQVDPRKLEQYPLGNPEEDVLNE